MSPKEIMEAAKRGPIYFLQVAGAVLLAAVDIPSESIVDFAHKLSEPEFITVNVVGLVLILGGAVISFVLSQAMLRAMEKVSETATPAQTIKLIEVLGEAAKHANAQNAVVQTQVLAKLDDVAKGMGLTQGQ